MIEVTILGSGSAGNACLIRSENTTVLVDAGLSAKKLCERLSNAGTAPEHLDAILMTHEHGDHANALKVLCKKFRLPLFANALTAEAIRYQHGVESQWSIFSTGSSFTVGSLSIQSFSVPHDAADPVGYVLSTSTARFAVLTDLGMVTKSVLHHVRDVDALLIETNYDETLLEKDTKRPWSVKQRIASRHGHLSNRAAAELLRETAGTRLQIVMLGHLSQDCNSPECATKHIEESLRDIGRHDVRIVCADRETVGPSVRVLSGAISGFKEAPLQTESVAIR